jgi:hypothetical protein
VAQGPSNRADFPHPAENSQGRIALVHITATISRGYYHRGFHLGYVPERHRWVADAIDDGQRLIAIVDKIKVGGLLRRRAKFVSTRIALPTASARESRQTVGRKARLRASEGRRAASWRPAPGSPIAG